MTHKNTRRGFTLIELLVVVLIIGVLAAIALPQYQVAVAKSRAVTMWPIVKSIARANIVYYLANGARTTNINDLDISMPGNCTVIAGGDSWGQLWKCGTDWKIDNSGGTTVIATYCPGHNETLSSCSSNSYFRIYSAGNQNKCDVLNSSSLGKKVCKSLTLN